MLRIMYFGFTIVKQSLPRLRVTNVLRKSTNKQHLNGRCSVDRNIVNACGRRKFYLGENILVNSEAQTPTNLKAYALRSLLG